ncbi:MAG: methylated-DNA--[Erysipelotrichales bacterium]|nr:methylated-DNA--[protein]-cysteine S-methyltransferase [Erysipelotrichales bacterium]
MKTYHYQAPFGILSFQTHDQALIHISFQDLGISDEEDQLSTQIRKELDEYFMGQRKQFTVPISLDVTPFQESVYQALQSIPYGETRTYQEIAIQIHNSKACRAVGNANHNNPIPIIIPCHRVMGVKGDLVGYAGGIATKQYLVELEKKYL